MWAENKRAIERLDRSYLTLRGIESLCSVTRIDTAGLLQGSNNLSVWGEKCGSVSPILTQRVSDGEMDPQSQR